MVQARDDAVDLVGRDGLLAGNVGQLLEAALEVAMTEELGYERHARSGTSPKTFQTDLGPVTIDVPRDRNGSFDPVIAPNQLP